MVELSMAVSDNTSNRLEWSVTIEVGNYGHGIINKKKKEKNRKEKEKKSGWLIMYCQFHCQT